MKPRKERRSARAGFLGIPSLVIAAGWIGLWFLWPFGTPNVLPRQSLKDSPRISYKRFDYGRDHIYRDPTVISLPFRYGFAGDSRSGREVTEPGGLYKDREPLYLGKREAKGLAQDRGANGLWAIRPEQKDYAPRLPVPEVLKFPARTDRKLIIRMTEALEQRGLELPLSDLKEIAPGRSWSAAVRLETGPDGRVEHVFLTPGSERSEIASKLVRILRKGYVTVSGAPVSGKVNINYGTR